MFAATGQLGNVVVVLFTLGIVAASFSSADSALVRLTTSFCVDIMQRPDDERLRRHTHIGTVAVFVLFILAFQSTQLHQCHRRYLHTLFLHLRPTAGTLCLQSVHPPAHRRPPQPYICLAAPIICLAIDLVTQTMTGYQFGYELLMLNGMLTFGGLWLAGQRVVKAS